MLAELALLRLEQPSVARSMPLPLEPDTPAEVVELLLDGLDSGRPFAPMTLDEAFDHASPVLDAGENVVDLPLVPTTPEEIGDAVAASIRAARASLVTFSGMVGADSAPIAVIRNRAVWLLPSSSSTFQRRPGSSQRAATTRARNSMSRRRSYLAAIRLR